MKAAPVPMCTHDSADEGRVILVRRIVSNEVALLDLNDRCGNGGGGHEGEEVSENSHADCRVGKESFKIVQAEAEGIGEVQLTRRCRALRPK